MNKQIFFLHVMMAASFITSGIKGYTYDYAICAIFQNEARFMKEWIEFHKIVGFQHFYLYNNLSTDNYLEVLDPYIKKGEVDLVDWKLTKIPGRNDIKWQNLAYIDALDHMRGKVKWAAFIDLDEYLFPIKVDQIAEFLAPFEHDDKLAGVLAKWNMFGHSNIECVPAHGLLTELLIMYNPDDLQTNFTKTIVRPERVRTYNTMHNAVCIRGFHTTIIDKDKIIINHYWTGDMKYLVEVKIPRIKVTCCKENEYAKRIKEIERVINCGRSMNVVEDKRIFKYIDRLKKVMFPTQGN